MSENQDIGGGGDDTEFWRLVLESYQQSGLSVKQFCTREGISPSSFYNWQKRLAGKSVQQPAELSQAEPVLSEEAKAQPKFLEVGAIKSLRSQLRVNLSCKMNISRPRTAYSNRKYQNDSVLPMMSGGHLSMPSLRKLEWQPKVLQRNLFATAINLFKVPTYKILFDFLWGK